MRRGIRRVRGVPAQHVLKTLLKAHDTTVGPDGLIGVGQRIGHGAVLARKLAQPVGQTPSLGDAPRFGVMGDQGGYPVRPPQTSQMKSAVEWVETAFS
jgi:hypothetical protein